MATAYAALVSLMNVLNQIQHTSSPASSNKSQIQSLYHKVDYLVHALESYSHNITEDLKKEITSFAFAAEDSIESYLLKIQSSGKETSSALFLQVLDDTIKQMDRIIQEAEQAKEKNGEQDDQLTTSSVHVGSPPVPHGDTTQMVGLDEEIKSLMGQLTSRESNRQIIPVVGMGGLGKTTLATNIYHHPHTKRQFDVIAWVTISQSYTTRSLFHPLLHAIGIDKPDKIEDEYLGVTLHKGLWGRSYLIVIDDIWDVKAWDEISRFCPEENNGSRILLTTRLSDVANQIDSCSSFELQLLNADKSWNLLSKRVFGKDSCPDELAPCGKKIAMRCKGLPLAIVVIGGLLHVSDRTKENWEVIERNMSSIISLEDDEYCTKVLSLSYHQLPIHLKPCLLYLATFPEDKEIRISEITKLWDADGFLKPIDGKTVDEVVLECLGHLINRNLVIVKTKRKVRGVIKTFILHDLVRDLCIKVAHKEMFLYVHDSQSESPKTIEGQRRVVARANGLSYIDMQQKDTPRSFICFSDRHVFKPEFAYSGLLRVFSYPFETRSLKIYFKKFVNIRFLKLKTISYSLSEMSSISLLLNLETLIAEVQDEHSMDYPLHSEFWNLRCIKHLIFSEIISFPDPPPDTDVVFQHLETLTNAVIRSEEVLHRIPNVKKLKTFLLRIENEGQNDEKLVTTIMPSFHHFDKLETLMVCQMGCLGLGDNTFPSYLRKLTLGLTEISWESMTVIGSLPNLEYLILAGTAFAGKEWETVEGEFQSLKWLTIRDLELVTWTVEEWSHFPCIEHLSLHNMNKLEEIPQVFAEVVTLASIKLEECSKSSVISAKQILDEQQSMGNFDLIVEVLLSGSGKEELKKELDGLPNDHFYLQTQKE